MKTKELIRQLIEADPSGELEVGLGADIHFVERLPSYYDGYQQVLIKDENGRIVGGKYVEGQDKVWIYTYSFSDAIWDYEDFPIEYSNYTMRYKKCHDEIRQSSISHNEKMELYYFTKYIKEKVNEHVDHLDRVDTVCEEFFREHYTYKTPIPEDIRAPRHENNHQVWLGYCKMREIQWNREVDIKIEDGMDLILTKKVQNVSEGK